MKGPFKYINLTLISMAPKRKQCTQDAPIKTEGYSERSSKHFHRKQEKSPVLWTAQSSYLVRIYVWLLTLDLEVFLELVLRSDRQGFKPRDLYLFYTYFVSGGLKLVKSYFYGINSTPFDLNV